MELDACARGSPDVCLRFCEAYRPPRSETTCIGDDLPTMLLAVVRRVNHDLVFCGLTRVLGFMLSVGRRLRSAVSSSSSIVDGGMDRSAWDDGTTGMLLAFGGCR
jgi:hypothetical protein